MKVLVVLGHPQVGSFCHALAEVVVGALRSNGHAAIYRDLYRESFAPLLPPEEVPKGAALDSTLQAYCDELVSAEGIVVVHPNWWGQSPAILKGWVDRVMRPGVAYEFREGDRGEGVPIGLLKAQAALVFNTSNTSPEREQAVFGDPLETLWKNCVFGLCGVRHFHRKTFGVIVTSSPEQRNAWLEEARAITGRCFPRVGESKP